MIPSQFQFLANHLWQSTLFAAMAGLLTLALRKNRAQTRYWLWLAASIKFLIPFSLLVDVGSHFGQHAAPAVTPPGLSYVIEQVSQPFSAPTPLATTTAGPPSSLVDWVPPFLYAIWAIGFATLICSWWRRWRGLRAALRTASPLDLQTGMEAMSSPAFAEPGVFGVRRPVLLLPAGITERLTPPQLKAIVAHELCHVRRHDNLSTAIHMGVEALFWFHPLVWWLGARLMAERERACDEEVLLIGNEPKSYAEGILKICELCLESPLPCVSGVTGANLRRRIEEIMSKRIGLRLSFARKLALTTAGAAAVTAPILVGILNAPAIRAQSSATATPKFEVASIKPCKAQPGRMRGGGDSSPGRLSTGCDLLVDDNNLGLIQRAYVRFSGAIPIRWGFSPSKEARSGFIPRCTGSMQKRLAIRVGR
jgi:bla regulator protein BlaR1